VPTLREPHRLEIHDLEVHHRIYERLGNEVLSYLVVLCRRCHQHYHGILPEAA
jgi:5-methylcytosine-specific restriction endonuclease McrA